MIPQAAALASALAAATTQDWRWMETADGTQYASLTLPSGVTVTVTAPRFASPEAAVGQARAALTTTPPT